MSRTKTDYFWKLFAIWTLAAAALVALLVMDEGKHPHGWTWFVLLASMAPLIGAQLALGSPKAAAQVRDCLHATPHAFEYTAGGFALYYLLIGILTPGFDPYMATIVAFGFFAALGALRQVEHGRAGLTWTDVAVWLLLWIPFDLRWNYDLWFGMDGFAYHWWAVALTVLGVLGWYAFRGLPDFGYRLTPRWRDIGIALLATAIFAAIVIPLGLAIDFLHFPPSHAPTLWGLVARFVGLFLTVALPEELFFRGILLHGLDQLSQRRGWMLFLSALLFGLMHWNNASGLGEQIAYVSLATLAGVFYGWAYRKSGNNLLSAVLTHSFVDLLWSVLFQ